GQIVTRRVMMNVPVDEALLQQIAQKTGGTFYRATDRESLRRIFAQIDRLEKTPLQAKRYVRYREAFPPLAWAALALLLLPLAPAAAAAAAWLWRRRLAADAAWASRALWKRLLPAYAPRRLTLAVATLAVAVLGASFALARPRWGSGEQKVERKGVDVVFL